MPTPDAGPAERRRLKRRTLLYYLRVLDRDTGDVLGHLVDVTTDGILVAGARDLEVGRTWRLRMILPQPDEGDQAIDFDARSVRIARDVNHEFIDTAFTLVDLSPHHRGVLETLIDDYGFRD